MNYIFQRDIYCHQLINPPAHDRRCNIDLQLSKSDGLIEFERKYLTSSESVYSIRLSNIQQVRFASAEQHVFDHEFRNLILAYNLVIQRTRITDKKVKYPTYELVRQHKEPEIKAKKIDNLNQVDIVEKHRYLLEDSYGCHYC
jgi:TPP-dependent 2-oxoacid decarboxylase